MFASSDKQQQQWKRTIIRFLKRLFDGSMFDLKFWYAGTWNI
jgi:hypothetical protein